MTGTRSDEVDVGGPAVPSGSTAPDPAHPDPAHPDPAHPDPAHPDAAHPDAAHPDAAHPDAARTGPRSSRRRPMRRLLRRTLGRAWRDDILSESASAAFWQTLSLPPLLLGLFGILGFVGDWFGPDTVTAVQRWIVESTSDVFSRNAVEEIIAPTVADVLTRARGSVVSVGFLLSLWSGSSAMASFVDAITRAHDQLPVRNFLWQRALSILMYLVSLAIGILLLPVVALGPDRLLPLVPDAWQQPATTVLAVVYPPFIVIVLVLALTTLYRIALPLKPPWYRGLPGALLAAAVFLVSATGLRLYLDWVTSTGYTYGALAAPIAFLLATFFIAFAIIVGAHFNAGVQGEWPVPLRRRGRIAAPRPTTPAAQVDLADAVRGDPAAAVEALEGLDYRVIRPAARAAEPVARSGSARS